MFVRRKPNKSGSFSIQVVDKVRGHYKLIKSFGSSKSEEDLAAMETDAVDFISTYGGQTSLILSSVAKRKKGCMRKNCLSLLSTSDKTA